MHTRTSYKQSRQKPAVVYWVHYLDHTDPHTQGYIGISTQLPKRIISHLTKNAHVGNRIRAGAVITILHEVESLIEAATIEFKYRSTENIGWNICRGGDVPPNRKGRPVRGKPLLIGNNRTNKQKKASEKHSERMRGRVPWNKGIQTGHTPWNKGKENPHLKSIANTIHICPHCQKQGRGSSMLRWHFENCRNKQ